MDRIKRTAGDHPLIFGLIVTIVYIVLLLVSALLGAALPGEGLASTGSLLGRILSTAVLLAVIAGFGWLEPAGFTRLGRWQTWLILLPWLAYAIAASSYAMTGSFVPRASGQALTVIVILFILVSAFMEEVAFRGLLLHAYVHAWGGDNRGLIRSLLFSSFFYASIHLFDFLGGRPLANVLLQSLGAFLLGVLLGALVLAGRSIYPAIFFHAALNLAGYFSFAAQDLEPTASSWLLFGVLMLPLAIFGLYWIYRSPRRERQALAPKSTTVKG